MMRILGDFIEKDTSEDNDFLVINFPASDISLQQCWRKNGIAAGFIADYLSVFYAGENEALLERQAGIKYSINYITSELLESAMKNDFLERAFPVRLFMLLKQDSVLLYVTYCVDVRTVGTWQETLVKVLQGDPHELFMEQLNENSGNTAGLKYLSMINDWSAKLAWKFESLKGARVVKKVTVMAQLSV